MTRTFAVLTVSALTVCGCSSTSHSDLHPPPDTGSVPDTAVDPVVDADIPETPVDIFAGAGDFVPKTPAASGSLISRHIAHTKASLTGTDCTPCHDGKTPEAPSLIFGGTVYYSPDAKEVAPGVEIRVVDANGGVHVTYSDQGGNFWLVGRPGTFPWPAHTGARNSTDTQLMTETFDKVGCNQGMCHDGSDDYPFITVRKGVDVP